MTGQTWLKTDTRSREIILMSVLFFAAFLPRLTAVNRYITPDELIWVFRSIQFHQALTQKQWLDTLTAGHPGVMTTWLGASGITLQLLLRPADTAVYEWVTRLAWFAPENMAMYRQLNTFLTTGRLLVAIINSLGVVLFFRFSRLLYGMTTAILASLLLAWDPFIVGLSGLLHVDGLLTTFVSLALLTLALSIARRDQSKLSAQLKYPLLSGLFTGLAILTKTPALLLLPFVAIFLFFSIWQNGLHHYYGRIRLVFMQGLAWLGSCFFTVFLLFPALWVSPPQVLEKLRSTSNRHIEEALRPTFFLGEVAFDHGFHFYPVTIAWRLSPIVFCGLILAIILIIRAHLHRQKESPWFRLHTWVFMLWPILFVAGINVAAKKYDRYALPAIPSLILVASLGWAFLPLNGEIIKKRVALILVSLQALLLLWFLPYPLSGVNMVLGGPWLAQRVFDVGWGEPVSAAGRWLAEQPGAERATAVTGIPPAFVPFFPGTTKTTDENSTGQAHYLVASVNGQSDKPDLPGELIHTIHYNGLDRALIFQQENPESPIQPAPMAAPPIFGDAIRLLALEAAPTDNAIDVITQWQLVRPDNGRYIIKLTLRDQAGREWSRLETALLNEVYFYPEHWESGESPITRHRLPKPPGLPPGPYKADIALFTEDGGQLPWRNEENSSRGLGYSQEIQIQPASTPPDIQTFDPAITPVGKWLDGRLALWVPEDFPPDLAVAGSEIVLDLIWQASAELPPGLQVQVNLGEASVTRPLSEYDTDNWRPGEIIHEKLALAVPQEALPGISPLQIQPLLADGRPLQPNVAGGEVEVMAIDRLFTVPSGIPTSREDHFADLMTLVGVAVPEETAVAGKTIPLTLYWQINQLPPHLVSVFVHLLGPDGEIVTQSDQWPGGLPVDLWAENQVIIDEHFLELPTDLAAGSYELAVGLYWSNDGTRLMAMNATGEPYGDNQVILPVPLQVETRP